MNEDRSLEGWAPRIGDEVTLDEVIERAFDYRGDVTVTTTGGAVLVGYVYNRNRHVSEPFVEIFDAAGASHTLRYREIRAIAFTGKDAAAGKSYEAWKARKAPTQER